MLLRFIVWFVMIFGGLGIGLFFDFKYKESVFHKLFFNVSFHIITVLLGILLLKFVLLTAKYTGRTLAKLGKKDDASRFEVNKLVKEDIYSCMRHPMHFGLLFAPLAIALISGVPTFIVFIAPVEMVFIIAMIFIVEEPEAIKKFGKDYIEYKKQVPMFSLKWSCLKHYFKKI